MELQLPDQPRCCDSAPTITKVTLGAYIFAVLQQDFCFLMFLERYICQGEYGQINKMTQDKHIWPSHAAGCFFTFPQGPHSRHAWKIHHNPFCAVKRFSAQKPENKSKQMYLARPWNTNIPGWWFQILFIFAATGGNNPFLTIFFFRWVETTN